MALTALRSRSLIHAIVEEDFDVAGLDAPERLIGDIPEILQQNAGGCSAPPFRENWS